MPSCFNCVRLFATPWTVVRQALLSVGFSRQECWIELPRPSPGDLLDLGIKPTSPISPVVAGVFFTTSATTAPFYRWENWGRGRLHNSCAKLLCSVSFTSRIHLETSRPSISPAMTPSSSNYSSSLLTGLHLPSPWVIVKKIQRASLVAQW